MWTRIWDLVYPGSGSRMGKIGIKIPDLQHWQLQYRYLKQYNQDKQESPSVYIGLKVATKPRDSLDFREKL
jgi:hypothetical protein